MKFRKNCASDLAPDRAKSEVLNFSTIAEAMGKIGKTEAETLNASRLYFGSTGTITFHTTPVSEVHKRFLWIMKLEHDDA